MDSRGIDFHSSELRTLKLSHRSPQIRVSLKNWLKKSTVDFFETGPGLLNLTDRMECCTFAVIWMFVPIRNRCSLQQLYRKKPGLTMEDCKLSPNVNKNRYRDVCPYDCTRVKLSAPAGDYINASFVNVSSLNISKFSICNVIRFGNSNNNNNNKCVLFVTPTHVICMTCKKSILWYTGKNIMCQHINQR